MSGKRYAIIDEIGRGRTGIVYRVEDRLTGFEVALHQVLADPETAAAGAAATRLALSEKLRRHASLRHPHINSVLDYGFDSDMRPYFTTPYLEAPQTLLDAGRDRPLPERLELLVQTLHALTYLHRRGVVHGDLRPRTVLVVDGQVKVVGFGLPALSNLDALDPKQILPYLPPEVHAGWPASEAGDLYAVGVLAYELLSGRPAFPGDGDEIRRRALEAPPEISTRDVDARAIPVLEKLLATDPTERYADAAEVIRDLAEGLGRPLPEETAEIRESFLQAASLVGRDAEMARLEALLEAALGGRGDVLLIAGETGVGKSRLLEELRILALSRGAPVLLGRASAEGFDPYRAWRDVLRWLCMLGEVDDRSATALLPYVPDLPELLDRDVPPGPARDPRAAQERFQEEVVRLFRRLDRPAVVILEDLHWAGSESLALLRELRGAVGELPLLVLGTYRDDQRPELARLLDEPPLLKLSRLSRRGVARLAEQMLGRAGKRETLVDFLHAETGGNPLFLVEVVQTLAEEAGHLERIDPARLPARVSSGGIRRVIRRRLERVPKRMRPLLRAAALAGRDVDLDLLATLAPEVRTDLWLRLCTELSVLEVADGGWRFVHDQMRAALVEGQTAAERRATHRRVAEAILETYGASADHVPALAYHWSQAADLTDPEATARAVDHLEHAGRAATASCALREAERLVRQGLELLGTLPPTPERRRQEIRLQIDLGAALLMSRGGTAPAVGQAFGRARALFDAASESAHLMPVLLGLWRFYMMRGDFEPMQRLAEEMTQHAEASDQRGLRVLAASALGTSYFVRGEPRKAAKQLAVAIDLQPHGSPPDVASAAFYLGPNLGVSALAYASLVSWCLGEPERARELSRRAVERAERLAHAFTLAFAHMARAWLDQLRGDAEACAASAATALELCGEWGFPDYARFSTVLRGWARARLGEAAAGASEIEEVLEATRAGGTELFRPYLLTLMAEVQALASRPEEGLFLLEEAIENADGSGAGWWLPELHRLRGELLLALPRPDPEHAGASFRRALGEARRREERALELRALLSLAPLERDDPEAAALVQVELDKVYRGFTEGLDTPDLVAARELLETAPVDS